MLYIMLGVFYIDGVFDIVCLLVVLDVLVVCY